MNRRELAALGVASLALAGTGEGRPGPPTPWALHGTAFVVVKSKLLAAVYLAPGSFKFDGYTQVMLDQTEVAFRKNWERDFNEQASGLDGRISDSDVKAMLAEEAATGSTAIFKKALTRRRLSSGDNGGQERAAGSDCPGQSRRRGPGPRRHERGARRGLPAREAGSATLVVEVRDPP